MAVYEIQDPQGRVIELEGDREPTDEEVAQIFAETFPDTPATPPSLRPVVPRPGEASPVVADAPLTGVPQAFPAEAQEQAELAKLPGDTLAEMEAIATTPNVRLPRFGAEGTVLRGASEVAAGLVEQVALTPASPVLGMGMLGPAARLATGTLMSAAAAKGAAQKLGEAAVTGDPQAITEGVLTGALAGLGALGVGAERVIANRAAPNSAQALRDTMTALEGRPATTVATGEKMVRLYRGERGSKMDSVSGGQWFTTNPEKARTFGDVVFLDTTERNLQLKSAQGHGGSDEFFLSPELAKEAKPLTLGAMPEVARKIQERLQGEELIDQQRIKVEAKPADVMPFRDWISSPEFEFRKDPVAGPLVTEAIEANLAFKSRRDHTNQQIEAVKATLSEADQQLLTKAMFAKEAGDVDAIAKLPPAAQQAWQTVRKTYDDIRERIVVEKQESVLSELSGPQRNALDMVRDGASIDEAAKANGLRQGGKAIVESVLEELEQVKSWGIEDYTTHIERGSYRVVTDDGTTIAVGQTRPEAAIKADRWLKDNPGKTQSLTITDEFNPGVEFPTKLSQGQYFRLVQRMKDNLGESAAEIQRLLHENGSIVAVKPTNKYAAPLQQRRNILKGEGNVFDVLPYYVHVMEKKLGIDPVLRKARSALPNMEKNTRKQVEDLLGDIKGNKSVGDQVTDHLLSGFGMAPFTYSRSTGAVRNLNTHLKLGYRPVAAAVNRVSGLTHTWTKVGTKYLLEGREWLKTPEGKAALEENKPYLGIEASFINERLRPTGDEPLWKPLGMFQSAEKVNRPEAFASHFKFAEGELGLTGQAAAQYARKATRLGQFVYDMASLPRAMRGPTGRLLFQFKPYLVKELEFISSLRGAEIPRYLAGFLAVGGPRAALYTLKSLPLIGVFMGFDKLEDWLNTAFPRASRGVGGAMGVDVSPSVAFQFPQTVADLLGPTFSDLSKLWKDVVGPALQGEDRDLSDVQKWAMRLAPALNYWGQLVEAAMSESGWITDQRGRPEYKPSKSDFVKLAMGAKPLNKSIAEVEERFLRDQETVTRKNKTRLIDQFLEAVDEKDGARIQELSPRLAEAGVTPEAIRSAAKNRRIEPQLRLLRSLSKPTRAREAERFAPDPESAAPLPQPVSP